MYDVCGMTDLELVTQADAANWYYVQGGDLTPEKIARMVEIEHEIDRRGIEFDEDGKVKTPSMGANSTENVA